MKDFGKFNGLAAKWRYCSYQPEDKNRTGKFKKLLYRQQCPKNNCHWT